MDRDLSPNAAHPGRHLGVLSFQTGGVAYYWSVLEGGPRNAVTFRGFSTKFSPSSSERTVSLFSLQGPVVDGFADLQDVTTIQSIDLSGGLKSASGPSVPLAVKIIVAPAPQLAFDGRNPHGVVLTVTEEDKTMLVATIADL